MTLYLKYRPQKIEELDLESVRESLKKIISSGKIPHAFLFSGPKGTGKTSSARLLAKVVNCEKRRKNQIEPCNKCSQCISITKGENLDVVELDAASHRGIDDIRSIREAVKLAPARANKKVYIIDEAHMLTNEASNALLKTLEEPPEHVMFILATTNPEKLIPTIRSRSTNILFKKASVEEIVRSLEKIVKGEKLKPGKEVLETIAKNSDGSFRDATKILEQILAEGKKLTIENVREHILGRQTYKVERFIDSIVKRDEQAAIEDIENLINQGGPLENFIEETLNILKSALVAKIGMEGEDIASLEKDELVSLITVFNKAADEVKGAFIEQLPLEIAVISWCGDYPVGNGEIGKDKEEEINGNTRRSTSSKKKNGKNDEERDPKGENGEEETGNGVISDEIWAKILSEIRPKNTSTEALLRASKPLSYDGKNLILGVFYKFHKERLETHQHKILLEEVIQSVLGTSIKVECQLTEPPKKESPSKQVVLTEGEDKDIIRIAKEIFDN